MSAPKKQGWLAGGGGAEVLGCARCRGLSSPQWGQWLSIYARSTRVHRVRQAQIRVECSNNIFFPRRWPPPKVGAPTT